MVLPPEEGQWLAGLMENAMRLSVYMPEPASDQADTEINDNTEENGLSDVNNDNDEVMFMGWPPSGSREHPWSERPRRRESRSRSTRRRPRDEERSRSDNAPRRTRERGEGARSSREGEYFGGQS